MVWRPAEEALADGGQVGGWSLGTRFAVSFPVKVPPLENPRGSISVTLARFEVHLKDKASGTLGKVALVVQNVGRAKNNGLGRKPQ